jgi:TolB-like protein
LPGPDIFLSYNREDAAVAKHYADAFAREGLAVWWDQTLRSGETYDEVTEAALRGAKAVVVLWSPRSVASHWVRAEATIAHRSKTLVPATIETCDKPVMFELTQTADLSHWRGEANDPAWGAFLADVWRMARQRLPGAAVESTPVSPTASATNEAGKPIVAVLPFAHRGDEGDMEYLAEDISDEITRELARNCYFEVIAASTMVTWRGKAQDKRALVRDLDARYLIEGKLQADGEQVRLTLQLIATATSRVCWSTRIARNTADVASSPEEFGVAIAAEIGVQIMQIEVSRAMTKAGPYSAWERIMRCMAYSGHSGADSQRRSIEEARHAVDAAPDLGLAHALLATAIEGQLTGQGKEINDELSQEIRTHITRASQLDGSNASVLRLLVTPHSVLGDGESALRLALRALESSPNYPLSHYMVGWAYMVLGRIDEAIAAFAQQERLTSLDTARYIGLACLGQCLFLAGKPDEAEAALDRALALNPDFHVALKWQAVVAAYLGDEATARAIIRRLREAEPQVTLDEHIHQIEWMRKLAERTAEPIGILRRLWEATEGRG